MDSLRISRRSFLRGTLAVSSIMAAGLPDRALATGRRPPTNVQVSHDGPGRGHSEPWLAVNPRDPRNLLAVSMWGPDAYVSFDGGRTWRSGGALQLPPDSGGGNVSAAFDGAGHGFVCGSFGAGAGGTTTVLVWRTEDGGRTFTPPVGVGQGANLDRPWLTAERHLPGTVHVAWSEGTSSGLGSGLTTGLRYARSTDGGRTFDTPRTIARRTTGVSNPMVTCGPPGTVCILYSAGSGATGNAPANSPSTVTVICSHDGGQTFQRPTALGRSTDFLSLPGHSDATGSALPAIAAHPNNGLVCAAFVDHAAGTSSAGVQLATSRDAGRTWSRATVVTPPNQLVYFQPELAINDAGRIGVMAFAINQGVVSVVLMISEPGSPRFDLPITVTDRPFDPAKANYQLGDYQTLATTPDAFHPLWNDTRTGQLELFTATVRP